MNKQIIDESNFHEYFFDTRMNEVKPGQCLARFRSRAEFIDGNLKRDLVEILLKNEKGGEAARKVMKKLGLANERDSIRIPLQMAKDLASGMTVDEVCEKVYEFDCEMFYYTDPDNVPKNDKKWTIIKLVHAKGEEKYDITSNINELFPCDALNTVEDLESEEKNNGSTAAV